MPPKGYKKHSAAPDKEHLAGDPIHTLPDPPKEDPKSTEPSPVPQIGATKDQSDKAADKDCIKRHTGGVREQYTAFLTDKEIENREFPNAAAAFRVAREKFLEVFA